MKKEFNILNYFNMRALFMGIGISKILIEAKEYAWLSLLLGTLLGALFLHFVKIEMKKSFLNVIVNSIFIIVALIILTNMISTMYLTEMPKFMVGLPIILLLLYILNKKEVVTYRLANVLLVLNVCVYTFAVISLIPYFKLDNFIYTNTPLKNILLGAFDYALFSTVPTLITRDKKTAGYSLVKTYLISSVTMSVLFILTYGILGENLISIYRYPEYIILKKISVMNFLENVQNIISFIWIFDIFIFLLANGECIKKNIDNPKLINVIIPLLFIITSFINKYYVLIIFNYKYSTYIVTSLLLMLLIANKIYHQKS